MPSGYCYQVRRQTQHLRHKYVAISGGIDDDFGEDCPSSGLAFKEDSLDRFPIHDRASTPGMEQQIGARLREHIVQLVFEHFRVQDSGIEHTFLPTDI